MTAALLACWVSPASGATGTLVYSDDFSNLNGWYTSNGWGDFMRWSIDTRAYVTPPSCLSHTPFGSREMSQVRMAEGQYIDLRGATSATLRFNACYNSEPDRDTITLIVHGPGGLWDEDQPLHLSGSTGGAFEPRVVDLSSRCGQVIDLSFLLSTVSGIEDKWMQEGVARIDDVQVWKNGTGVPVVAPTAELLPKVSLGTPVAPRTMKRSKSYTVYGSLKPRHTKGTKPVRIYKYKKVGGKWVKKGYATATAYDYKGHTRYKVKMKLSSKGSWRLRACAPADSKHATTWSSKYDYVKVR